MTGLASATPLLLPPSVKTQQPLVRTSRQTAGPFYVGRCPVDIDNDLGSCAARGPEPPGSRPMAWVACSVRIASPSQVRQSRLSNATHTAANCTWQVEG